MRWQGPLTLWFDGKYGEKYKILVTSGSVEKNFFLTFFNITSMGEKLFQEII